MCRVITLLAHGRTDRQLNNFSGCTDFSALQAVSSGELEYRTAKRVAPSSSLPAAPTTVNEVEVGLRLTGETD